MLFESTVHERPTFRQRSSPDAQRRRTDATDRPIRAAACSTLMNSVSLIVIACAHSERIRLAQVLARTSEVEVTNDSSLQGTPLLVVRAVDCRTRRSHCLVDHELGQPGRLTSRPGLLPSLWRCTGMQLSRAQAGRRLSEAADTPKRPSQSSAPRPRWTVAGARHSARGALGGTEAACRLPGARENRAMASRKPRRVGDRWPPEQGNLKSGRRESNPRSQLGKLMFCR